MRHFLVGLFTLLIALPTIAQDVAPTPFDPPDTPLYVPITFDNTVTGSITDAAFFDWWEIELEEGDEILIEMQARDGLAPLVGILDSNRDLQARSDDERIERVNGLSLLQYRAPADGIYLIVPTRVDNEFGDSTGSYDLTVSLIPDIENDEFVQVEFRCSEMIITNALELEFTEEINEREQDGIAIFEFYRLTVYGLDGFQPIIRAQASVQDGNLDCSGDAQRTSGNEVTFPDGTELLITENDLDNVAQLSLRSTNDEQNFGVVSLSIGSLDGTGGRYIAFLEGLQLSERQDVDQLIVRKAPFAKDSDLDIYMVGDNDTRLDPTLTLLDEEENILIVCDDAGRADCDTIASFTDAGTLIRLGTNVTNIRGDRFDAGVTLTDSSTDPFTLTMQSRNNDTNGAYTLVFIGSLPTND